MSIRPPVILNFRSDPIERKGSEMSLIRLSAMACVVFAATSLARAADPTAWLPKDVNAVARINVAEVYKTPLAKKEGWLKKATESFIQQETSLPPGVDQILIGADLNLTDNLTSHRRYTVIVPEAQMTLDRLSEWLPGGIETISGKRGAQFGPDAFVIDAGDGCWLATSDSSRQNISRWLKAGPTKGGTQLSPYLKSALTTKANTAQMILAIDLQDNFSRDAIEANLKATDWFPSPSAAETVADVLASAYGITIGIAVDQERTGRVDLDFGKDASALKPVLDKLVDAIMQRVGASTDEFSEWKWTVKGSRVTGTGPVSPGGGRRLLSVLDPPSITHVISSASTEATAENKVAKTSQMYCKSVRVLLDDLRDTLKKTKDNHALWFERYGRKIDDLPKLNVDSELLDYSAKVSSSLRYQGQVQRMSNINAGVATVQSGANYTAGGAGFYGPYGAYGWFKSTNPQAADSIRAEANQQAKEVRFSEWKQIEDGLADIRRRMTEKYQLEF
jgi:hypothetical protein